ncbi:hypothetical protein G9A89_002518, partial [Geosiphon pyriformis]
LYKVNTERSPTGLVILALTAITGGYFAYRHYALPDKRPIFHKETTRPPNATAGNENVDDSYVVDMKGKTYGKK